MFPRAPAAVPTAATPGRSGPAVRSRRRPTAGTPRPVDPASDHERLLYGALLDDVRLLHRRGFGVHREPGLAPNVGKARRRRFRVGNRLVSATRLRSLAARERRLLERP
jgi:hypothetical protein